MQLTIKKNVSTCGASKLFLRVFSRMTNHNDFTNAFKMIIIDSFSK